MKKLLCAAMAVALSGCMNADGTLTTKSVNVLNSVATVGCVVDGVVQPLAMVVGPAVASANGIDADTVKLAVAVDGPLHLQIQSGCAALRGTVTAAP